MPTINLNKVFKNRILNEFNESILPKDWCCILSDAAMMFRHKNKSLPSVKIYYRPTIIDIDFKVNGNIKSERRRVQSVDTIREDMVSAIGFASSKS